MKIEILYPELTNIYGDGANIKFLKQNFKKSEIVLTSIKDVPYFVNHKVDLIYMGSHPDEYDEVIINSLKPYKAKLMDVILNGTPVLFTGNAIEVCIEDMEDKNKKLNMLSLFKGLHSKRNYDIRYNSLFLGDFEGIKIIGNQSTIFTIYGNNKYPFIKAVDGCIGLNNDTNLEGIHYKNFFATSLLGPFLILNPLFTKYLFSLMGYKGKLIFEEDLIENYKKKLEVYEDIDDKYIGFE